MERQTSIIVLRNYWLNSIAGLPARGVELIEIHSFIPSDLIFPRTAARSSSRSAALVKAPQVSASILILPVAPWASPHAFMTKGSLTARQATSSMPLAFNASKCVKYPGKWVAEQPGVKAPGTPNNTPFLPANSLDNSTWWRKIKQLRTFIDCKMAKSLTWVAKTVDRNLSRFCINNVRRVPPAIFSLS